MPKRKLRVLIDAEVLVHPHFSGIGHYTLELLRALDELADQYDIQPYLLVYWRQRQKAASFDFKNIKIIPSPFSQRITNALKIRALQFPLDLVFGKSVYLFPNYSSWPLAFSKSISFIYDLSFEKFPEFAEPRNQAFLSEQVKKTAARTDHIATISENSKDEIVEFYGVEKKNVSVLYPAVDHSVFYRRSKKEIEAVKKKYGISGNYILFFGNIEPRKNLKSLLLAYEKLDKTTRKKYPLLLVGAKGWQDGEIFEIIKKLRDGGNDIQRPSGHVEDSDRPAIFSGASLFVFPSVYEGFGIPPVEAMACGVPVVSSDNSSLPEAVGDAAVMVDANSVEGIAAAIERILGDELLSKKLVETGYQQSEKFSWRAAVEQLISVVKEVS